jgi:hypothetical protein
MKYAELSWPRTDSAVVTFNAVAFANASSVERAAGIEQDLDELAFKLDSARWIVMDVRQEGPLDPTLVDWMGRMAKDMQRNESDPTSSPEGAMIVVVTKEGVKELPMHHAYFVTDTFEEALRMIS